MSPFILLSIQWLSFGPSVRPPSLSYARLAVTDIGLRIHLEAAAYVCGQGVKPRFAHWLRGVAGKQARGQQAILDYVHNVKRDKVVVDVTYHHKTRGYEVTIPYPILYG